MLYKVTIVGKAKWNPETDLTAKEINKKQYHIIVGAGRRR